MTVAWHISPLKTSASADEARKNPAKKRSLHGVNEHFEPDFDAASSSAVVFQRADILIADSFMVNLKRGLGRQEIVARLNQTSRKS